MNPVQQTLTEPPEGNCFASCVATILELPLDQVPNFHGSNWWEQWQRWLAERNMVFISCDDLSFYPLGYSILGADSPRGLYLHAVVMWNARIVWDPSPDRHQGVGEWHDWAMICILDPSLPCAFADVLTRPPVELEVAA